MTYWQMDDGFMGHHKTRRAIRKGAEALVMWAALRTYVSVSGTDGFIPDEEINDLPEAPKNPRKWLRVLVECGKPLQGGGRGAGLVDPCGDGWMLHDYLDHALPAAEIARRKRDAADRQQRWRDARNANRKTHNVTRYETSTERVENAPPSHPIPSHDLNQPEKQIQRPDKSVPDEKPEDLQQLCLTFRGNPTEGQHNPIQSRPEVVAVAHAFWDALKLAHQRLGSYGRDKGVTAICELYADGFTQEQLVTACKALPSDEWAQKQKRPGLTMLTPEVVRRLLQPPREEPKRYPGYKTAAQLDAEEAATRERLDAAERRRVSMGKDSTGTRKPRPEATSAVLPIAIKTIPDSKPKKRSRQEELEALAALEEPHASAS